MSEHNTPEVDPRDQRGDDEGADWRQQEECEQEEQEAGHD